MELSICSSPSPADYRFSLGIDVPEDAKLLVVRIYRRTNIDAKSDVSELLLLCNCFYLNKIKNCIFCPYCHARTEDRNDVRFSQYLEFGDRIYESALEQSLKQKQSFFEYPKKYFKEMHTN